MGKMALLIVLGLSIAFMFLGYTMNSANVRSVDNMSAYYKYSTARNIAQSAVSIALHKLENGGTSSFSGEVMSGSYNVEIHFSGAAHDTLNMISRGQFTDTSYTLQLKLHRYAKPFPNVQAAVMLAVDSVDFKIDGNASIDGRNHDVNGNVQSDSSDKSGVYVGSMYDSTNVAQYNDKITGSPKISIDMAMSNPKDYINEYIAQTDYFYGAGTYGANDTWGSENSPAIVVCDAGSGTVKFAGTITGWGILVVKGNLTLSGAFKFTGLVLVYQDSEIDDQVSALGTPRVIGAIILAGGAGSKFTMKGNGLFAYSRTALDNAQRISKLQAYKILEWYE